MSRAGSTHVVRQSATVQDVPIASGCLERQSKSRRETAATKHFPLNRDQTYSVECFTMIGFHCWIRNQWVWSRWISQRKVKWQFSRPRKNVKHIENWPNRMTYRVHVEEEGIIRVIMRFPSQQVPETVRVHMRFLCWGRVEDVVMCLVHKTYNRF